MKKPENPYIEFPDRFTNTKEFSYLAIFYEKNKCYTLIPKGTLQYKQFWEDCRDKCINGMTNSDGIYVTGQYFFYLNFVQILGRDEATGKKRKIFPRFVDLDWEYFMLMKILPNQQKSFEAVKGRRQGWSYKAAGVCSHEFSFFSDSSCIISAYLSSFSQETMNMTIDNLNFLNANTEFKKQRNPDTKEFIQAKYQAEIGGTKVWKGTYSKVQSITFKNNDFAAVGKSANWLVIDEAGVFPNIQESYNVSEPLIKDGGYYTGVALVFGSAGNMEQGSQYFYEMFINPANYNMLEFPDPDNPDKKIGFFSSAAKGRWGICMNPKSPWYQKPMVDDEGNSNIQAATDDLMFEREKKKKGNDSKALHDFITQFPLTYKEAFLRTSYSPYPTYQLNDRLVELETTKSITDAYWVGRIKQRDNVITFENTNDRPIDDFPYRDNKNLHGAIQIFEQPFEDNPPFGIYIAACDPYDDDSSTTNSLGSTLILNTLTDRIVAEYTGRPDTAKEFYENTRKLLLYYNAVCNYENNKKGMFSYFDSKNCSYLLADTPKHLKDAEVIKTVYTSGNNSKGTPATVQVNAFARSLTNSWLRSQAFNKEEGVINASILPSIPLLKELTMWNPDGNFDRHAALGMLMILREDRIKIIEGAQQTTKHVNIAQDDWFKRNYKSDKSYNQNNFF